MTDSSRPPPRLHAASVVPCGIIDVKTVTTNAFLVHGVTHPMIIRPVVVSRVSAKPDIPLTDA